MAFGLCKRAACLQKDNNCGTVLYLCMGRVFDVFMVFRVLEAIAGDSVHVCVGLVAFW